MLTRELLRHLETPAPVVRLIEVRAVLADDGSLRLDYCLRGDMARLRIPEATVAGNKDGLWEHTCFEAFASVKGTAAYREYNFSPAGDWAAYAFHAYRQIDRDWTLAIPPRIDARLTAGRLELGVVLAAEALPPRARGAPLLLGLAAVVEAADTIDGSHSYWALRHPAARPDFHHRDGFILQLVPSPGL